MLLSTLLKGVACQRMLPKDVEITGITTDSRQVQPGYLFICIRGRHTDGHVYAQAALNQGASALVMEQREDAEPLAGNRIVVKDSARAYALICANYYGRPAQKLKLIGVTGTNGKTTTTHMIRQLLEGHGEKVGLMGTIENVINNRKSEAAYTTPTPDLLHRLFGEMVEEGCTCAVAEVSSQALDQERMFGLRFHCAVFTNLTQDHLDYHGTMENYYQAKKKLFTMADTAVINIDDPWGARLCSETSCDIITVSARESGADYYISGTEYGPDGMTFVLTTPMGSFAHRVALQGEYNLYNIACATAAAHTAGVPEAALLSCIDGLRPAKGRLELVDTGRDFTLVIDYAHTPDALEKALQALAKSKPARLVCLFGCGGDRDAAKRPIMGKIAAQNSDFVIVTSDNPRTENPSAIIDNILVGMCDINTPYIVIENRQEAIGYAVKTAKPGDVILLAGKGHETYQILDIGKIPFDEKKIAESFLRRT